MEKRPKYVNKCRGYLTQLRKDWDLTPEELTTHISDDLQISVDHYLNIEKGISSPKYKQLVKLLLALSQIYCISIYDMMSMETDYVLRTLDIDPDKQLRRKNINQEFGQALRTILKVSGVKQTALAGYLGCTKQYIQLLITGKRHCAKETRHKICVYLGLPEDHFDYIYVMYAKEEEDP